MNGHDELVNTMYIRVLDTQDKITKAMTKAYFFEEHDLGSVFGFGFMPWGLLYTSSKSNF